MIDIKKVRLDLFLSNSMKIAGCHVLSRETYNEVHEALTELERLQKHNDLINIIESGYKAIESGEAFEHGFPESRLIPSNWNELCLKGVLDGIIEKITPLIKEYLQDELTYQEAINDRDQE